MDLELGAFLIGREPRYGEDPFSIVVDYRHDTSKLIIGPVYCLLFVSQAKIRGCRLSTTDGRFFSEVFLFPLIRIYLTLAHRLHIVLNDTVLRHVRRVLIDIPERLSSSSQRKPLFSVR